MATLRVRCRLHLDEEYFGGSGYVHVGATASTGGATNLHQVRFVSVDAVFEGDDMSQDHHATDMTANDHA